MSDNSICPEPFRFLSAVAAAALFGATFLPLGALFWGKAVNIDEYPEFISRTGASIGAISTTIWMTALLLLKKCFKGSAESSLTCCEKTKLAAYSTFPLLITIGVSIAIFNTAESKHYNVIKGYIAYATGALACLIFFTALYLMMGKFHLLPKENGNSERIDAELTARLFVPSQHDQIVVGTVVETPDETSDRDSDPRNSS